MLFTRRLTLVCSVILFFISANITYAGSSTSSNKPFVLSENLDVDPSSGSAALSIPIEIPQGRGGIEPGVTLFYNSTAGNGLLGMGWNLELGSIQRSSRKGVPSYTSADTFVLTQAGSQQELVDVSGTGTLFKPEMEGSFSKIAFNGTSWTLTDKHGVKYTFGTTAATQVYDPAASTKVYKWMLERVEDLNGNYMTVTYVRFDNNLFPLTINYTGNTIATLPTHAQVKFIYESKTASADLATTYNAGFFLGTFQRITNIESYVGTNLQRRYTMNYTAETQMGRSLLTSVTVKGDDGVTTLPATVLNYSSSEFGFQPPITSSTIPLLDIGAWNLVRVMDMNGDGKVDIVDSRPNNYKIYFNQSASGAINFSAYTVAQNSPAYATDSPDIRVVDLNGDGFMDIIYGHGGSATIWINNGVNGFNAPITSSNSSAMWFSDGNTVQFMDMNGDGKLDMVETPQVNGGNWKIFFNTTGSDFAAPINAVNPPPIGSTNVNIQYGDFNGDGLSDVIQGELPNYKIWINNGVNGYNPPVTVSNNPAYVISDPRVQLVDMNGDGLTDIVDTTVANGVNPIYKTYFNNGKINFNAPLTANISPVYGPPSGIMRFMDFNEDNKPDVIYGNPATGIPYTLHLNNGQGGFGSALALGNIGTNYGLNNVNMAFGDINGDGRLDIIEGYSDGWRIWRNNTDPRCAKPATLVDMDNSLGMHLELKYQHLPILNMGGINTGSVISPFLFNSVKTISKRANLQGQVYTATYNYQGGLWSLKDREFRGFKTVKIIDPDGNYATTEFLQDDIYKGRPNWQASYDVSGNLFSKTVNTWNSQTIATGVVFPFLKRVDSYVYDGNASAKRTAQEFFYAESPQYGNITKTINYGEVNLTTGNDIGTDTIISEVTYHNNTANWLIGLPKYTTVKDVSSNYLGKAWLYYDNVENQTTLPVKGLLSKKVNWAGDAVGTVHPFSVYAYDTIGNLLSTANNAGNTTSITYDSTYKIFPLTTSNPLSQVVTNEYYGVNGVALSGGDTTHGLWGQLKSTTDPNAQKGLKIYDALGRVTKTVSPNDTISLPTMSSDYIYGANELKVITKSRIQSGNSAVIESVQFYDGMGRGIQAKAKTEIPGRFVVTGQTEYNLRGLPVKKYGSYYTTVSLTEMTPIDTAQPAATITYDAMGRVIRTTNPDGSYANGIYDDWTTTSYDENGHMQKSYANSSGQLIKKEEYLGADGRHTVYPASAYTLYATTLYAYDLKGNLIQTTDTKGNITTIQYDALGRKISMTDPDMGTWTYGYDVEGNLLWQQDAKGQRTNFTYDVLNRLKQKSQSTGVLTVDYTYDDTLVPFSKGRLTKAAYTGGNTTFGYDNIGRELQSIKTIGSATYNVNRTYDDLNRLVTLQYPDTSKAGYTYNDAGAVNSIFEVLPTTTMPSASGSDTVYIPSPYAQYRLNDNAADYVVLDTGLSHTNGISSANTNALTKPGKLLGSLSFNGTSQYINLNSVFNKIRSNNKGTFSFWVKPEAGSSIITFAGPGGAFSIEWYETNQSLTLTTTGTAGTLLSCTTPTNSVPNGGWSHIAVVQDGTNLKIYVNGQDQSLFYWNQTNKGAWLSLLSTNISNGRIGALNTTTTSTSNNAFFRGSLDDVRYYLNRALVPQEIWGIYNNSFGTEVENPPVTNTAPTNVTTIAHMASAFAQYKLNDTAVNTAVLDATVGYNDGVASVNTSVLATVGKIGNSLTFNGINQNVDMGSLWQDIRTDTKGSFAFWIKPVNNFPILGFGTSQGGASIEWYKANQSLTFSISGAGTPISFTTPTGSLPGNVWSHVAIVQDSVAIKVYINGVLQQNLTYWAQGNLGAWFSFLTGTIGNAKLASSTDNPSTIFFQGGFDDLRYYQKALSSTEVSALYNSALGTEDANPALGTDPTPLPPVEASTVPASAGRTFIKNIDYNANGQISKIEYGNGVTTTYTFDPVLFRLTGIKSINALNATLQDFSYTYDGIGNILSIIDRVNTANQTFTYDELNRLKTAVGSRYGSKTYSYDQIGNITAKDGLTYTYSKVAAGPHAVTSLSDGTTLTYDLNGNTIRKSKTGLIMEYIYDAQNRLIQVKKNTTLVADFVYDGDDGRVQKTTYVVTDPLNHTSGALLTTPVVTKYVGELYEEASNVGTKFVYLGSRKIAAVSTADSSIMFYQEDHLGGTNITTDINGLSKEVIEYDPYGKIVRDDSTLPTANLAKSQFTGKKIDDETGLYYYGARYYDPSLGRFITPDTIVQSPANPQTLNRYSYCGNNPVNRIDPSGHSWKKFWKRWGSWISPIGYAASTGNWSQLAILAVTVAANFLLPGIGTLSNVYLNIGAHALVGAAQGALVGGITSIIGGGSFGDGARLGAITGGITGALQGIGGSIAKANAARNASVNAGSAPSTGVYKAGDLTREFNSMQADVFEKVSAADKLMKWANNTNDLMKELGGLQDSWSPFDFVGGGGLGKSLVRSGLNAGENAVFYTGGNIAKQNAMAYARSIGAKTILDTPIGKALEIFKAPDALWKYSSSVYANSATGVAHVFVGEGASWSRTFASTEAGILEKNGIEMIFH